MDLSDLLGTSGGLLNQQQQQGSSNSDILQSMGAAMMRAAGPSQFKHTTLSGLGDAMAAGVAARRSSQDDALKRTLVSGQINQQNIGQRLEIFKAIQPYLMDGSPIPPQLQALMQSIGGGIAPSVGGAMGQAPGGGIGAGPPQAAPGPPGAAPQAMPGPGGAPNAIKSAAADMHLPTLPLQGNFGAISDLTKNALAEHIRATDPAISANEAKKEADKVQIAASQKQYEGIQAMARVGHTINESSDMAKALMEDPDFKSGFGADFQQKWKQFLVSSGHDPGLAFSQEAFNKVTSEAIQAQLGQAKAEAAEMGGSAGRIFQSQIGLIEKSSPNGQITSASNRFLVDQWQRIAKRNIEIGNMASDYMQAHDRLDAGWDKKASKYMADNPLYSKDEHKNLRAIATGTTGAAPGPMGQPQAPGAPPGVPMVPGGSSVPPANMSPPGAAQAPAPQPIIHVNKKTGQRGYIDPATGKWTLING